MNFLHLLLLEPAASEGLHLGLHDGQASADNILIRDGLHDQYRRVAIHTSEYINTHIFAISQHF